MATNIQGNLLISNESTLVERIYFNTELTIEEVVEILSKLTLTNNGYYAFLTSDYSSTLSLLGNHTSQEYVLFGIDGGSPAPIFATSDEIASEIGATIDWTGWNPNLVNPMEINSYGVAEMEGYSIGTQNDLLTNLISMNTDFALSEPITNLPEFLTGIADAIREKKGTTDKINAQNMRSEIRSISASFTIYENTKFGEVIPNSGVAKNLYLNVAMDAKDIFFLLNNLPSDAWTEISDEYSVYFLASVNVSGIVTLPLIILKLYVSAFPTYIVGGVDGGKLTTILTVAQQSDKIYNKSFIEGVTEDTNLIELLGLNNYTLELLDTFVGSDSDGILAGISAPVGQYNNLLIKLIAITKFLDGKLTIGTLEGGEYLAKELTIDNETIDVLEIMSNKEIPIKVSNVNLLQKLIDSNRTIDYLFKGFHTKEGYLYKNLNLNDIYSMQYAFFGNGDDDSVFPYLTIPYEKIVNADNAFNSCDALIGEVTMDLLVLSDAQRMFEYASNLESITFPNGTPKLTVANNMFGNCTSLKTIKGLDLGNLTSSAAAIFASGVTNGFYTYDLPLLTNLDIKNIKYGFRIVDYDIDRSELTSDSLVGLCKECIKQSTQQTLSIGNINLTKLADVYVKFTDSTVTEIAEGEKGEVEVCESTDEGAMTIQEYMALKSWRYAG